MGKRSYVEFEQRQAMVGSVSKLAHIACSGAGTSGVQTPRHLGDGDAAGLRVLLDSALLAFRLMFLVMSRIICPSRLISFLALMWPVV